MCLVAWFRSNWGRRVSVRQEAEMCHLLHPLWRMCGVSGGCFSDGLSLSWLDALTRKRKGWKLRTSVYFIYAKAKLPTDGVLSRGFIALASSHRFKLLDVRHTRCHYAAKHQPNDCPWLVRRVMTISREYTEIFIDLLSRTLLQTKHFHAFLVFCLVACVFLWTQIAILRINKGVWFRFRLVALTFCWKKLIWALRHLVIFTTPDGVTYCLCGQLNHQSRVSNTAPDGRQRSFSCSVIAVWGERFNSLYGSSLSISVKQQTLKKKTMALVCETGAVWVQPEPGDPV